MEKIDVDALLKEMDNVPFGNSRFQIDHFTDGQETPERRYRHVLLQLRQKISALKTCEFGRRRLNTDIEEIQEKLKAVVGKHQIARLEVDLDEKQWQLREQGTLIKDAMVEVDGYVAMLANLPKPSRKQFEAAEPGHWRKRLVVDAKNQMVATGHVDPGTLKALGQVGMKMAITADKQICFVEDRKKLEEGN